MTSTTLGAGTHLVSRARTITESDLVSFAAITGDWHPQHVDAEWAADSHFGERIAHGMLVLSYSVGLMGFDPERVVALRGIDSLTFKRPVAIGDTIRAEADVDDVRPIDDDHELVELRWRVLTGDEPPRAPRPGHDRPPPGGPRGGRSPRLRMATSEGLYGERVLL